MRFAIKSDGGITEAFLHAEDVDAGIREGAAQLVEDYGLPVHLELWTVPPDGGQPGKRAAFRFVAVNERGDVIDLD